MGFDFQFSEKFGTFLAPSNTHYVLLFDVPSILTFYFYFFHRSGDRIEGLQLNSERNYINARTN